MSGHPASHRRLAWAPDCMDEAEYEAWRVANATLRAVGSAAADRPCRDCTAGFAAEMTAVGRCNGVLPSPRGGRVAGDDRGRLGWPGPLDRQLTEDELFAAYGAGRET